MSSTKRIKRGIMVYDDLYNDIINIADENGISVNDIVDHTLRLYRDRHYMDDKAFVISDDIIQSVRAEVALSDRRQANRINPILSSIAIELYVLSKVVTEELDVDASKYTRYRQEAVEELQAGQRVFGLADFSGV